MAPYVGKDFNCWPFSGNPQLSLRYYTKQTVQTAEQNVPTKTLLKLPEEGQEKKKCEVYMIMAKEGGIPSTGGKHSLIEILQYHLQKQI